MSYRRRMAILACCGFAALLFLGVAIDEFSYAHAHPHAYGPAVSIGVAATGGVLLAVAGCLLLPSVPPLPKVWTQAQHDEHNARFMAEMKKAASEASEAALARDRELYAED